MIHVITSHYKYCSKASPFDLLPAKCLQCMVHNQWTQTKQNRKKKRNSAIEHFPRYCSNVRTREIATQKEKKELRKRVRRGENK